MAKGWTPEERAAFGEKMRKGRERAAAERAAAGTPDGGAGTPAATLPIEKSEPTAEPRRRGLFSKTPAEPKPPAEPQPPKVRPEVRLAKADTSEGLAMVYGFAGQVVAEADVRRGGWGSTGRAMQMTAPTAGRLLAEGAKRFPVVHNLLAAILGTGAGVRDAGAVIGIPIIMRRMERDPRTILPMLPVLRAQMRPVLRDMLKALKEERKLQQEIENLQREIGEAGGEPFNLDQMILCDMLGLSVEQASAIVGGADPLVVLGFTQAQPEPVEAVEVGSS